MCICHKEQIFQSTTIIVMDDGKKLSNLCVSSFSTVIRTDTSLYYSNWGNAHLNTCNRRTININVCSVFLQFHIGSSNKTVSVLNTQRSNRQMFSDVLGQEVRRMPGEAYTGVHAICRLSTAAWFLWAAADNVTGGGRRAGASRGPHTLA